MYSLTHNAADVQSARLYVMWGYHLNHHLQSFTCVSLLSCPHHAAWLVYPGQGPVNPDQQFAANYNTSSRHRLPDCSSHTHTGRQAPLSSQVFTTSPRIWTEHYSFNQPAICYQISQEASKLSTRDSSNITQLTVLFSW